MTSSSKKSPFSLRLSDTERIRLNAEAGSKPLGEYIRSRLLGAEASPRRKSRQPSVNQEKLALVLAELGKTHLSSNMNQLARAVNTGGLSLPPDVANQLSAACDDIRLMRESLISALGVKAEACE